MVHFSPDPADQPFIQKVFSQPTAKVGTGWVGVWLASWLAGWTAARVCGWVGEQLGAREVACRSAVHPDR